ncbi:MAG: stage II sporulation protein M [archaeon]
MLEMLINPKKAERKPWEMFFVGIFYSAASLLFVDWIFLRDTVMSQYTSMLIITFATIFCIPFMYFLIRLEETKDIKIKKERILIKEHGRAIAALTYLFLGFIVGFSLLYILMPQSVTIQNFKAQIEQYCAINMPQDFSQCLKQYGLNSIFITGRVTGNSAGNLGSFLNILTNNVYVLIFILVFSLAFGAGAIFILAWNASVIAAAIGLFTNAQLHHLHIGLMRYLIHGLPELGAYFIGALAGGILSIAIIRHDFQHEKFWNVLRDSVDLIIIAILVLVVAALIEVFITPALF